MPTDCSLLCSLQLWTLKYAGLHERDIHVHSYQQKPETTKQSILPFAHSKASNAEKNNKKKAIYYDEFNDYFTSRSLPFHLSNRLFQNLRDKLIEFDQLLSTLKLIRTIWLRTDVIFVAFSNGVIVFLHLDSTNRTLKQISIDKTSLNKKFHINAPIADIYLNAYGFYVIYETLSKIDLFHFTHPVKMFHPKFLLANESVRLISEELPPYSNNIAVRRWFEVNHDASTLTVWWSMLSEGLSTNTHLVENDQRKSRFNCLAVVFQLQNENEKEKLYPIQTETSNPFFCSSTPSGLTTVELNEHSTNKTDPEHRRYELNIFYYENFRSVPLRLVHVPSISSSIQYVIRSSSHTIVCLVDGTLLSIDEINHIQRMKTSALSRNLTGLWWIIDNLLFALADTDGSLIFYDIALNPIWPVLSSFEKLNVQQQLHLDHHIVALHQLVMPVPSSTSTNLSLVIQFSSTGPIGLLHLHFPFDNIHSLLKFYLNSQNYQYAIDLFWTFDWTRNDQDARLALSYISQELFRRLSPSTCVYMEEILRTFYSPLRPISDASILRNRSFVNQIATKFFYYFLREKFYSKAFQLAKHFDNRSIYLDLYYACDHDQEKTIRNLCAQRLNGQSNQESAGDDDDDQSDLSVTSSDEDASENQRTVREKYPTMNTMNYSDINEILTSAIEHYQLDENVYKFLVDRIHAP